MPPVESVLINYIQEMFDFHWNHKVQYTMSNFKKLEIAITIIKCRFIIKNVQDVFGIIWNQQEYYFIESPDRCIKFQILTIL